MALTLNGSTGVSGVDGSAGTPAIRGTDADSGVYFSGSSVGFSSNGSGTTMTMDSSGNVTFPGTVVMSSPFAMRNKIINGAMEIAQRRASASVTQTTVNQYVTDRFFIGGSVTSKFSAQRSTTAPGGFVNSLACTSLSAYSVGAAETYAVVQRIEGTNIYDLQWGTASAKAVTLSFWTRSTLTGTFGGSVRNSASDRSYPFAYSISAADTWEYKTITIPGDTTGTWLTTNGIGIGLAFSLGTGATLSGTVNTWAGANYVAPTGAVSVVGTNAATWYITGVQLEVGSVATPFERRLIGQEIALCQRYYVKTYDIDLPPANAASGGTIISNTNGSGFMWANFHFPTEMRAAPTATIYNASTGATGTWRDGGGTDRTTTAGGAGTRAVYAACTTAAANSAVNGHIVADAEL